MNIEEKSQKRGFFITFEGPEGAGKSTQVAMLAEYLRSKGLSVISTREPGGTPLAEKIREVVKGHSGSEKLHSETELLLMEAARSQHVRELILPQLEKGVWVICDRFSDSTIAYQGGARGLARADIDLLNAFSMGKAVPDLTFLMDLSPEDGFARTRKRSSTQGEFDRFEAEDLSFHYDVRRSFLALAEAEPARIKRIDAGRTPDVIHKEIAGIIDEFV